MSREQLETVAAMNPPGVWVIVVEERMLVVWPEGGELDARRWADTNGAGTEATLGLELVFLPFGTAYDMHWSMFIPDAEGGTT